MASLAHSYQTPLWDSGSGNADLRHDVRMDGVYFFRARPEVPFRLALEKGDYAYCVMVRKGALTLTSQFPEPVTHQIRAGDVVGVSGLTPHVFTAGRCDPDTDPGTFEQLPLIPNASGSSDVELTVGVVPHEMMALTTLVGGTMHLTPENAGEFVRRIWKAEELLDAEFGEEGPLHNQAIIVRRIAEIILINMTRSFASQNEAPVVDLARGGTIFRGLRAFFEDPFGDWTVEGLAQVSGMSRTKFAEEFRKTTGKTPIQTLTRTRLTMIARTFLSEGLSVEDAADRCGYNSAAAFVRAFQREFGQTPARWRKQQIASAVN